VRRRVYTLRTMPRRNRSVHEPYQDYYDDFTRELVAEFEADIIERYGYTFEGQALDAEPAAAAR
jgi:hypothetical protein